MCPCYGGAHWRLRRAYCVALRDHIRSVYGVKAESYISDAAVRQLLGQDLMSLAGYKEIQKYTPELVEFSPFELRELVKEKAHAEFFALGAWTMDTGHYSYA